MPRKLTPLAIQSALARDSGTAWFFIIDITHKALSAPLRYVNNNEDVFSNGYLYKPLNFSLQMSLDDSESIPSIDFVFDNVGRDLMEVMRSSADSPEFDVRIITSDEPDEVQVEVIGLSLLDVSYDAYSVTGTLYIDDLLNTRYPADIITIASGYQGLFRQ